jgi:hypothetical protein
VTRILANQRGDAFILSIIAMAVAMVAFLSLQTIGYTLEKKFAQARVRNQLSLIESQIRQHFRQPNAFTGCQSQTGVLGCQVNQGAFARYGQIPVRGGLCSLTTVPQNCHFKSEVMSFDTSTRVLKIKTELANAVSMNASEFSIEVPDEILQSSSFTCAELDASKPVMVGLDPSTGQVRCRGLQTCPAGQHMVAVNGSTAQPQCAPLPSGSVGCPGGQMLQSLEWKGGAQVTHSCQDRLDPFNYFGGP